MTAVNGSWQVNGQAGSPMVGLTYLFAGMSKDFRDGVVKRALDGAIAGVGGDAGCVAPGSGVMREFERVPQRGTGPASVVAGAGVAGDRAERRLGRGGAKGVGRSRSSQLRERVDGYLRERGLVNGEPDYSGYRIAVMHPDERWNDAMEGLAEENPEVSRDDLALMSSYISGWIAQGGRGGGGFGTGRGGRVSVAGVGRACGGVREGAGCVGEVVAGCAGVGAGGGGVRGGDSGNQGEEAGGCQGGGGA